MYDLGSANKHNDTEPTWYVSYSFKEEYGLPDLSANSLNNWLSLVPNNDTLLTRYYRNFYKQAQPSLAADCNQECKRQLLNHAIVEMKSAAYQYELCLGLILVCMIGQYMNASRVRFS